LVVHVLVDINERVAKFESIVTPSGNSGQVVVPKAWIRKETMVKLKEKEKENKSTKEKK
jgi:putative transposon-encoded protein